MIEAVKSPWLVPFDGSFRVKKARTKPPGDAPSKKECRELLRELRERLQELQHVLYADDRYAILLVFQAMDAAGKDGTIRAVLEGVNPSGCQVYSFKQPSIVELDHDFLWRTTKRLPQRGRIGVFNRSHYEEVLVVRVHPALLEQQNLPPYPKGNRVWDRRFRSIRDDEEHLARNGTIILKFWLNVSKEEQRKRFLSRLDEPEKNWKFSSSDVRERGFWDDYMAAYEDALNATSRPDAPWYAIPADDKPYMRLQVAELFVETLERLDLHYPEVGKRERERFDEMRALLEAEG